MRRFLYIIQLCLLICLIAGIVYQVRLPKPSDRVGREANSSIEINGVRLTAHQAIFTGSDPIEAWCYSPNVVIIGETANAQPTLLKIRIANSGAGPGYEFSGPGLVKAGYDKRHDTVLDIRIDPGKKTVVSLPRDDKKTDFTFVILGDNRGDLDTYRVLLKKAISLKPDWIVNLGDLVDKGRSWEYEDYDRTIKEAELPVPLLMTPGNHDIFNNGAAKYRRLYGPGSFSFDYGRWHFVALETSDAKIAGDDLSWLSQDLQTSIMPQAMVFTHVPLEDPRSYQNHDLADDQDAKNLQEIFVQNRVAYVTASHIHSFYEFDRQGIRHLITGGAGAPLLPDGGKNHLILVKVKGDDLSYRRIDIDRGDPYLHSIWYYFKSTLDQILRWRFIVAALALLLLAAILMSLLLKKRAV